MATVDQNFFKEMDLIPRVSPEFELTLDTSPVIHSIQTMNFFQMKGKKGDPSVLIWKIFFYSVLEFIKLSVTLSGTAVTLTHCRWNRLSHTIYWKTPISILGSPAMRFTYS